MSDYDAGDENNSWIVFTTGQMIETYVGIHDTETYVGIRDNYIENYINVQKINILKNTNKRRKI